MLPLWEPRGEADTHKEDQRKKINNIVFNKEYDIINLTIKIDMHISIPANSIVCSTPTSKSTV